MHPQPSFANSYPAGLAICKCAGECPSLTCHSLLLSCSWLAAAKPEAGSLLLLRTTALPAPTPGLSLPRALAGAAVAVAAAAAAAGTAAAAAAAATTAASATPSLCCCCSCSSCCCSSCCCCLAFERNLLSLSLTFLQGLQYSPKPDAEAEDLHI